MTVSQFLPDQVEQALATMLDAQLADINVDAIGIADINDDDELVLQLPAVRVEYIGTEYEGMRDSTRSNYNAQHIYHIWCAAENLVSKAKQRSATKQLVGRVLPIVAGARLILADGSQTSPIELQGISKAPEDIVGMIYIVRVAIPGLAQFPGTNSAGVL